MDNVDNPVNPDLVQQKGSSFFSQTVGVKTLIFILLASNLMAGLTVYFAKSTKTQVKETVQPSASQIESYKDMVAQLERKVVDLEMQNSYLRYIDSESAYLNLVPPEVVGDKLKVQLYYYNSKKDREIADFVPCVAVLPVEREIPITITPIRDTIELLIKGELTDEETAQGFGSEFPNPDFKLLGVNLADGILTLTFTPVPSFTTGGSCRIGILEKEISLTAKQFSEVEEVRFEPDPLFKP